MIPLEVFKQLEIRIGTIRSAARIPETDRLLLLSVDMGEEKPRQIVSGIAGRFGEDPAALVGTQCAFAANLEPRTIKGYESQGMILAVNSETEPFALLVPDHPVPPGAAAH